MRVLALALTLALADVAVAQDAPTYDATELLAHIREPERAGLSSALGVGRLEDLPLYDLHVSIAGDLSGFGAREIIHVTNVDGTAWSEIVLRIYANESTPPRVEVLDVACEGVACATERPTPSTLVIRPPTPLAPGAHLRIRVDLRGALGVIDPERTSMLAQSMESMEAMSSGQASGDYGLLAQDGSIATLANFHAVLARRRDGAFVRDDGGTIGDLGSDAMANVRARVVAPDALRLVATGALSGTARVRDPEGRPSRTESTFVAAAVRDFAVVASPTFTTLERDVSGVMVRAWCVPADREACQVTLDTAASSLEVFERSFGAYPYTELDVVEAALIGGAGGVELSALVLVASMFYRDDGMGGLMGGGDMQGAMLEFVTAHEVAHQWWHGVVGSDSRAHPYVDESLAQWSAVYWVEARHGTARAAQEAERQVAMGYVSMRLMGLPDAAVDRPADAFAPLAYGGLVYGKGPFLYRELRTLLGDEAFFAGVREYVRRYRFGSAPPRGLIEILATGSHARAVRRLARRWLEETHGDADLGPIDQGRMMSAMLPPELAAQLSGGGGGGDLDQAQLRPLLERLMQMMGSGGEGGDSAEALEAFQRMMGDLPEGSTP